MKFAEYAVYIQSESLAQIRSTVAENFFYGVVFNGARCTRSHKLLKWSVTEYNITNLERTFIEVQVSLRGYLQQLLNNVSVFDKLHHCRVIH